MVNNVAEATLLKGDAKSVAAVIAIA